MNFYTTEQIIDALSYMVEEHKKTIEGCEYLDAACTRLISANDHIKFLQQRLDLAEKVIGELYLLQEETTR